MTKNDDRMAYAFAPTPDKDAARRLHESVSLHMTAASLSDVMDNVVGKWLSFRLSDGTGGNEGPFQSKAEAITYREPREKDYCYLKITPDGITPEDAWRFLRINRHPMIDVTAPEHVHNFALMPHMSNLSRSQRRALERRLQNGR